MKTYIWRTQNLACPTRQIHIVHKHRFLKAKTTKDIKASKVQTAPPSTPESATGATALEMHADKRSRMMQKSEWIEMFQKIIAYTNFCYGTFVVRLW